MKPGHIDRTPQEQPALVGEGADVAPLEEKTGLKLPKRLRRDAASGAPWGATAVRRWPLRAILWLAVGLLAAAQAAALDSSCQSRPLNILLTNDDGYDTPGIVALHNALARAGHHVKRVAPAENQSGSGTSLSFSNITLTHVPDERFSDVYAATTTPATAVVLGATTLFPPEAPVDLVVSGINQGANLGPATPISGTVGAVIAGLRVLQPQVPGIAVSTNPVNESPRSPENLQLAGQISSFITRLIERLQARDCDAPRILPADMALNVNYPPLAPADLKGVRLATQGKAPYFAVSFQRLEGDVYVPSFGAPERHPDAADADTRLFNEGYVTIVPLDGDYTAEASRLELGPLETLAP